MMDIPQPSAIKPAEDEVNDIHSGSTSNDHHRYFLMAGSIG